MTLREDADLDEPVLNLFCLRGKTALVTGGSRGIGLQVVRGLAEAGASVALVYHTTQDALEKARAISKKTGVRIETYRADVTVKGEITAAVEHAARDFGRLDVVVANAGVCANVESLDYTAESWHKINSVNYDGVMWTSIAAGKIFKTQGYGRLIMTASVSSVLVNVPQAQAAYNASKAAVAHLGKCLAVEWAAFARVNCVSPGYVNTEMVSTQPKELMGHWLSMIPMRRVAQPAELRGLYVFLASDASSYITGSNIIIDGGYSSI